MAGSQIRFRADIEGLRGIAILAVVAFHCGFGGVRGGFVGVDVFFALSGYLITGLLVQELESTSTVDLMQFYGRRVRRLLPASAFALLVTLGLGAVFFSPNELTSTGRAARASALYMSNVFFSLNAADYFGANVETNPILHTWSLAVEEQFYFVWPVLIWACGKLTGVSRRSVALALGLITVTSFGASVVLTSKDPTFAFYQLPARAWEFGVGGLAAIAGFRSSWSRKFWQGLGIAGLLAILTSIHFVRSADFPGLVAAVPVGGTVAALVAGRALPTNAASRLLQIQPLQFLGRLSYSWYLWHWPFLVLALALYPSLGPGGKILAVLAALLTAYAGYCWIENPIRFHPWLVDHPVRCLCGAAVITVLTFGLSTASLRFADILAMRPEIRQFNEVASDISRLPRQACVTMGDSREVKTCEFGAAGAAGAVVLFGDSHAIQWFGAVEKIANRRGWKLHTFVKSGCPATDVFLESAGRTFATTCQEWRREAVRRIIALRPALVVIANSHKYIADIERESTAPLSSVYSEWEQGIGRTFAWFSTAKIKAVLVRDNPVPGFDVPACLVRSTRIGGGTSSHNCDMDREHAIDSRAFAAETAGIRGLEGVWSADLSSQFCDEGRCFAVRMGEVVYRDDNHLTGRFAEKLSDVLEVELVKGLKTRDDVACR